MVQEIHPRLRNLGLPQAVQEHIQEKILPQLRVPDRRAFFDNTLPAALQYYPKNWELTALLHGMSNLMTHLPPEDRGEIFQEGFSAIIRHRPSPAALQHLAGILPLIARGQRHRFIRNLAPQILEQSNNDGQVKQHFDALGKVMQGIPQNHHGQEHYLQRLIEYDLPDLVSSGAGPTVWKHVLGLYPQIHPNHRLRFLRHVLPYVMDRRAWSREVRTALEGVSELLPLIPRRARGWFYSAALADLVKSKPTPERLKAEVEVAKKYLQQYPKDYFYGKVVAENFGRLASPDRVHLFDSAPDAPSFDAAITAYNKAKRSNVSLKLSDSVLMQLDQFGEAHQGPFVMARDESGRIHVQKRVLNRLRFRKTGSRLIPLVGPLMGYLIRQIRPKAYEAWKKAHLDPELRDHVEPIVENDGILHGYEHAGKVLVLTRHVGTAAFEFKRRQPKFAPEVERQRRWILKKLRKKGIQFSMGDHAHDANFLVELVNGQPHVRLIDFDQARLRSKKKRP